VPAQGYTADNYTVAANQTYRHDDRAVSTFSGSVVHSHPGNHDLIPIRHILRKTFTSLPMEPGYYTFPMPMMCGRNNNTSPTPLLMVENLD